MPDRAAIADIAQQLRNVRDRLEKANHPFDQQLGAIHSRLGTLVNDLRAIPITPVSQVEHL